MSERQLYRDQYYADRLQDAYRFQDFVMWQLAKRGSVLQCYQSREAQLVCGESVQGIELKHARLLKQYSAIYIETDERNDPTGEFFPSGICAPRPAGTEEPGYGWLYGVGDFHELYLFRLMSLLAMHHEGKYPVVEGFGKVGDKKVCMGHGFLLPKSDARKAAARHYRWSSRPPWMK